VRGKLPQRPGENADNGYSPKLRVSAASAVQGLLGDQEQEKTVLPFRSFVHTRCGTATCSSPWTPRTRSRPPGAKGLNLAIHDVKMLFEGLDSHYNSGSDRLLEAHSDRARERLWKAQQFSYWLTTMLQTPADADDFFRARKLGELNSAVSSRHGKAYPGWPTPAGPPQLRPN